MLLQRRAAALRAAATTLGWSGLFLLLDAERAERSAGGAVALDAQARAAFNASPARASLAASSTAFGVTDGYNQSVFLSEREGALCWSGGCGYGSALWMDESGFFAQSCGGHFVRWSDAAGWEVDAYSSSTSWGDELSGEAAVEERRRRLDDAMANIL